MKKKFFALFVIGIAITVIPFYWLAGVEAQTVQVWLQDMGIWTPAVFAIAYTLLTLFMLPTTPLNLTAGVLFGPWLGLLWTSLASITASLIGFIFTRTYGRNRVARMLKGSWKMMDAEMAHGGLLYIFAIRLLPIIPCGVVNFASGLTSISFKKYLLGTVLGTIPGLFPFILLGSEGVKAIQTGEILPLLGAFTLSGLLIVAATWYRHRRLPPRTFNNNMSSKS